MLHNLYVSAVAMSQVSEPRPVDLLFHEESTYEFSKHENSKLMLQQMAKNCKGP